MPPNWTTCEDTQNEVRELKERVKALETMVEQVGEAIEKAKSNPMVANMMKMFGM